MTDLPKSSTLPAIEMASLIKISASTSPSKLLALPILRYPRFRANDHPEVENVLVKSSDIGSMTSRPAPENPLLDVCGLSFENTRVPLETVVAPL